jgi:uncharacterized protein with NRDE domain
MCLLLLLHRIVPGWPIVVGANRDELYSRESLPPIRWPGDPEAAAPVDIEAGGTWIGVNARGLVAAITNRPAPALDPRLRSRGLLCRDALRARTVTEAERRALEDVQATPYNPFNLLLADADRAVVLHHDGEGAPRTLALEPGAHVLTNFQDVDSVFLQEIVAAFDPTSAARSPTADALLARLAAICRDHDIRVPGDHAICKHLGERGTVSSTILLVRAGSWREGRFLYADGPPCRSPYREMSALLGGPA